MSLRWNDRQFKNSLEIHIQNKMKRVVLFLEAEIKKLISRGNRDGSNPSKDGEPPKVVTGTLRSSIASSVIRKSTDIIGVVGVFKGPATKYASALELGLRDGTTRPYLMTTVKKHKVKIINMLR